MQLSPRLLTHTNLQRLLEAIGTLSKPMRPEQLPRQFTQVLQTLIPGEFHGVSVVVRPKRAGDLGRRETTLSPAPADWESLAQIFASQYRRFPLRPIRESGDLYRPLAVSDIASRRKFESLDLYHDYYRVLGVADDLSVNFGELNHRVCVAILRARRGFSTQDRTLLAALRPHLELAYRYASALASLEKRARRSREPAEHTVAVGSVDMQNYTPGALRTLGLSEREAEVLYWVAAGKSGPVISTILGIRHDTVRAHLKKIFSKLGVENRLSAALQALQVLRSGH
jgi:DNA-binding CsgD family transcriptional regulator